MYIISEKNVIEMPGSCEFSNPDNDYSDYDDDWEHDFDFVDTDKEQCLQTCLQKLKLNPHAVGCYFAQDIGHCVFLKSGTIVGSSGASDPDTCWKFHQGNIFADQCACFNIYLITSIQVGNRLKISYNIVITKANTSTTTPATTTSHAMTTIRSTTTMAAFNTTTRPSTSTGHKNEETSTTHVQKGNHVPFLLPSRGKKYE